MSAETIAIVISAAGLLLGLAVGFGWMIKRTDDGFTVLRGELSGEIKALRDELGGEIRGVRDELVEVKIAVARIEGPGRHLIAR